MYPIKIDTHGILFMLITEMDREKSWAPNTAGIVLRTGNESESFIRDIARRGVAAHAAVLSSQSGKRRACLVLVAAEMVKGPVHSDEGILRAQDRRTEVLIVWNVTPCILAGFIL
jgi:hypothetical protein